MSGLNSPIIEHVTKLEAARRQLATAIDLWFNEKDTVSSHTLAFAAYEIIDAVTRKMGRTTSLLYDAKYIPEDKREEVKSFVRKSPNFFKHGSRDPLATIDFRPESTQFFILFSIAGIESINLPRNKHELAFVTWLMVHRRSALNPKGLHFPDHLIPIHNIDELRDVPKKQFLEFCLEATL
jgi:hypothetical protein